MGANNLSFLLGSGISLEDLPNTAVDDITTEILSNNNLNRWRDENQLRHDFIQFVNSHLTEIKRVNNETRPANYEEIFTVLIQLIDFTSSAFPRNLFYQDIFNFYRENFIWSSDNLRRQEFLGGLPDFFTSCRRDITETVIGRLDASFDINSNNLKVLEGAVNDNGVSQVNIFTLNNDLLIDNILRGNDLIEIIDGFVRSDDGVELRRQQPQTGSLEIQADDICFWQSNIFLENNSQKKPVFLLKLHGSINWLRSNQFPVPFYLNNQDTWNKARDFLSGSAEANFNRGNLQRPNEPLMLVGTLNKLLDYSYERIFVDIYYHFCRLLEKTNRLVISGYGFQDAGINRRLSEWIQNKDNKVIVIDPQVDNLPLDTILGENNLTESRVVTISENFSGQEWENLRPILFND